MRNEPVGVCCKRLLADLAADLGSDDTWTTTLPVADTIKDGAQVLVLSPGADTTLADFRDGPVGPKTDRPQVPSPAETHADDDPSLAIKPC